MCGKGSSQPSMPVPFGGSMPVTSSQSVTVPPEILARYNAINARAEAAANQPFQSYSQDPNAFVAPLSQSQQSAIQNINQIQGMTEPYYQQATQMAGASTAGVYDPNIAQISTPFYQQAQQGAQNAMQGVANYNVPGISSPYYQQSAQMADYASRDISNPAVAQVSSPYYQQSAQSAAYAGRDIASQQVAQASQPYYQQARALGLGAAQGVANQGVAQSAMPYYQQANQYTGLGAQGVADLGVAMASEPAYGTSGQMVQQGARGVADLGVAGISSPYYQQAQQLTGMAGQVQVPELSQADIQKYMSPYMQQVIDPTMQALRQQQEQAMAGQTGNAIRSGAFGGDRAALAAATLAGQQQLAQGQTMGGLLQQGYGQALTAAQQQQQVRQAEMARVLQAGRQQADIGTMARQAYEQQQAVAQQDQARMLQAAQQYAGLGTLSREALQQQQAMAQQDAARQLQAAQQATATGTAVRGAYEQQQAMQQADLARQLQVAQQQQGLGTAERQALEQQQTFAQADAARQLQMARQQLDIGTAARQALEQQQAFAQSDAARQLQVAQQQMGLGTAARQAYEQQQALQQADLQRQIAAAQQLTQTGTAARQAYEQQQTVQAADLARLQSAAQLMGTLGTGAQTAALAAAQAQLGAGAVEQQTGQAGIDALLNQFQQERGYPFQTAQFLANIGLGTGAASGSTTTTAQAQPFFSDKRLKSGLGAAYAQGGAPERVGELNSGEGVYSYRLTDPRTGERGPPQIGLMSDEVRPDAVMKDPQTGYDMVDYGKATENARMGGAVDQPGDYARGGVAFNYTSPDSLESQMGKILAMQEGIYKGRKGSGSFMSTPGYVPLVDVSTGRMLEPARAPEALTPQSSQIMSGIEKAGDIAKGVGKLYDFLKIDPLGGTHTGSLTGSRNGGVVGYAHGGMPYEEDSYIPDSAMKSIDINFLKPAEPPPAPKKQEEEGVLDKASGFVDKAGKLASTAGTVYTLGKAAMTALPFLASFSDRRLKEGLGYADGGSPEEDEDQIRREREIEQTLRFEGKLNPSDTNRTPSMYGINQAAHPGIDVKKLTPEGAKEIYRKEYWEGIGASKLPESLQGMAYDTAVMAGPGRARQLLKEAGDDPEKFMAARENFLQGLISRDPEKYGKYGKAWANRNQTLREQAGLGNADAALANIPAGGRSFSATTAADRGLGPATTVIPSVESASERGKDIGDFLTSKEFIIPALTGLGAMASSPSRYLGSAILQGVGAGAQSYMDVLGKESELAKRAAETGEVKARTGTQMQETEKRKAETLRQYQDLYKDAFFDRGGIQMVRLADGSAMSLYEWMKNPTAVWGQGASAGTEGGAPAPAAGGAKEISVSPEAVKVAPGIGWDDKSASSAKSELGMLNTPGKAALESRSAEYRNMVDKDAETARDQKLYNNEVAGVIAEMASKTGAQAPGATGSMRAMIINYGNTISRAAGRGNQFGDADTANAILEKINTLAGEARVSSAGQQALGSLTKVIGAYPNLDQPPGASSFNAASNMVNNQMKLDRQQHADAYGQESGQLYSRAGVDFKRANTPAKYKKEQDALQSVMMRDPEAFSAIVSGRIDPAHIEEYFRDKQHGGIAGMSRYFGD